MTGKFENACKFARPDKISISSQEGPNANSPSQTAPEFSLSLSLCVARGWTHESIEYHVTSYFAVPGWFPDSVLTICCCLMKVDHGLNKKETASFKLTLCCLSHSQHRKRCCHWTASTNIWTCRVLPAVTRVWWFAQETPIKHIYIYDYICIYI